MPPESVLAWIRIDHNCVGLTCVLCIVTGIIRQLPAVLTLNRFHYPMIHNVLPINYGGEPSARCPHPERCNLISNQFRRPDRLTLRKIALMLRRDSNPYVRFMGHSRARLPVSPRNIRTLVQMEGLEPSLPKELVFETNASCQFRHICTTLVPSVGFEPTCPKTLDPKSSGWASPPSRAHLNMSKN